MSPDYVLVAVGGCEMEPGRLWERRRRRRSSGRVCVENRFNIQCDVTLSRETRAYKDKKQMMCIIYI